MKKQNLIIVIVLGVLIILLAIMLLLTPIFKKIENNNESNNVNKIIDDKKISDNKGSIFLGVNVTTEGDGLVYEKDENSVYINKGGVYSVTGTLINGSIIVNTKEEVKFNLYGVVIKNSTVPFLVKENSTVTLNLESNSVNLIGKTSDNGAIESNGNINITGSGYLVIDGTFKMNEKLDIKSGNVVGINNSLDESNVLPKQNTIIFNFEKEEENKIFALIKEKDEEIISFKSNGKVNNIMISSSKITNNNYSLYKDITHDGIEELGIYTTGKYTGGVIIKFNNLDNVEINKQINVFGAKK